MVFAILVGLQGWPGFGQSLSHLSLDSLAADSAQAMRHYQHALAHIHQLDTAVAAFGQALPLFERSQQWGYAANTLNALHYCHFELDEYQQAARYAHEALALAKRRLQPHHLAYGYALSNMGSIFSLQGDYSSAATYFWQAVGIQRTQAEAGAVDAQKALADGYSNLGVLLLRAGDDAAALDFVQQALALKEATLPRGPKDPLLAKTLQILAEIYQQMHEVDLAVAQLERIGKLLQAETGPDARRQLLRHYQYMADLLLDMGRVEQAKNVLWLLERMDTESYRPEVTAELQGEMALASKAFRPARQCIHQALLLRARQGPPTPPDRWAKLYELLAQEHMGLAAWDSAAWALDKAFAHLGLDKGEKQRSLLYPQRSFQLLQTRMQLHRTRRQPTAVVEDTRLLMQVVNQLRQGYTRLSSQEELAARAQPLFVQGVAAAFEVYQQEGDATWMQTAFAFAEQAKSMPLYERLQALRASRLLPDSVQQQRRRVQVELAFYERLCFEAAQGLRTPADERLQAWKDRRFALREQEEALEHRLEAEFPDYARAKYRDQPPELSAMQAALANHTAWLAFSTGDTQRFAWLVLPDTVHFLKQDVPPSFDNTLRRYLGYLSTPPQAGQGSDSLLQAAYALSRQLLPVELFPHRLERLIISPDGLLHYLPFEALLQSYDQGMSSRRFSSLPFWVKRLAISYQPSARLWAECHRIPEDKPSQRWAGFAPSYSSEQLQALQEAPATNWVTTRADSSQLPFAVEEVQAIARSWGGRSFVGTTAREQLFKQRARAYAVLHLATHGLLNDRDPRYNYLLFAPPEDSTEDGFLQTVEMNQIRLNADLVVLSACNTGSGLLRKGEGILSLARGFAAAGSRSLLLSLWQVPDRATSQLMQAFYAQLRQGLPKDLALQQAQLAYLSQQQTSLYAHPYFWAGFVLMGNMQPLDQPNSALWWGLACGLLVLLALAWRRYHPQKAP